MNKICDGDNNVEECGFDGGDCKANNSFHEYWLKTHGVCNKCLFSDGECNDINNNIECEFDGGDCDFIQGKFQVTHNFTSMYLQW